MESYVNKLLNSRKLDKQKSKFFKSLSKDKKIKAIEISSKSKEFGNNGLIGRLKDLFIVLNAVINLVLGRRDLIKGSSFILQKMSCGN